MIGNVRGKKERGIVKKKGDRFRGVFKGCGCGHLMNVRS